MQSWKLAYGRVKFDGKLDIAKLAARFPRESMQLDRVRGIVAVQGRLERDSPTDDTPGLNLSVTTSGLALVGPSTRTTGVDGTAVISPPAWSLEGIDLGLDARIDGDSGFAAVALRLSDEKGALAALDLEVGRRPLRRHPRTSRRRRSRSSRPSSSTPTPAIPPRDLKMLPALLALKGLRGTFEADANATGTLLTPVIDVKAKVTKGRMQQGISFPIDLDLTAHYFGKHATVALGGVNEGAPAPGAGQSAPGAREVIDARFDADVAVADLLHGNTSAWKGSGHAHLDALQLDSIPALADRQVTGTVTGDLSVLNVHQDGQATFSLDIDALKVGQVAYKTGFLKGTIDGKTLDAKLHLDQEVASAGAGSIDATAQAGSKWGTAILPSLDPSRAPTGELQAKSFRAALLFPFVDDSFTQLDGKIDADLKLSVDPRTGGAQTLGTLALSQGRFELASIGGEFHDVKAKVAFLPDGVVKIEEVSASAMSGRIEAAATARVNGLVPSGANATVQIPKSAPLLLTVQGAQVGTVDGKVNVTVDTSGKVTNVKVEIPSLHVELPLTSSRDVQALGEMDGVRIGLNKGKGAFVAERLDAPHEAVAAPPGKTINLTIALGSDVVVKKSTQLSVGLTGTPVLTIGDAVRASGQVRLLSGKIDVQGKSFDIDSGTVTFMGDPTDPQVVVTASWTAADGTRVYAQLRGTLKKPSVTLRSEPSFPKDQIIALLLYGSADATSPNSGAAAGVAGGAATQPLNRALENMGLGGVSTRVDTSAVTPRADVEVQIARNLSLQIAELMGAPPPGTNPDLTLLTLSWRFAKAWSAQTTIGDAGTTIVDLIWQHRY